MSASSGDWAVLLAALLGAAVVLGVSTLALEQPGRVGGFARTRRASVAGLAVVLVAIVAVSEFQPGTAVEGPRPAPVTGAPLATVLAAVRGSDAIERLPSNLDPPLAQAVLPTNFGAPAPSTGCSPGVAQSRVPACVFGDRNGAHTMVLYGDSHAGMWFDALDDIATRARWKLIVLWKAACPAGSVRAESPGGEGVWVACERWHRFALARINRIDPDLLIVSQSAYDETPSGRHYTPLQWRRGLQRMLDSVMATQKLVLGDIPSSRGPDCLAQHTTDVQACSLPLVSFLTPYDEADASAARLDKARFIDVKPWFCRTSCSSVIGVYSAYYLSNHVAVDYSRFLEGVLASALDLSRIG